MCGTMYMVIVMIMGYSCKNIATSKNLSRVQNFHILTDIETEHIITGKKMALKYNWYPVFQTALKVIIISLWK